MMSQDTKAIRCYLNGRRSSQDRAILARLRADAAHGKAASAITRRALAEHYGLEQRPTLARQDSGQIDALAAQVSALAQSVIDLQQQVSALTSQIAMMQQQQTVTAALLAVIAGNDKDAKRQAQQLAGRALASMTTGNGNGHE